MSNLCFEYWKEPCERDFGPNSISRAKFLFRLLKKFFAHFFRILSWDLKNRIQHLRISQNLFFCILIEFFNKILEFHFVPGCSKNVVSVATHPRGRRYPSGYRIVRWCCGSDIQMDVLAFPASPTQASTEGQRWQASCGWAFQRFKTNFEFSNNEKNQNFVIETSKG